MVEHVCTYVYSVQTYIGTQLHTSQRLCESQNAEPEGAVVSQLFVLCAPPSRYMYERTLSHALSLALFALTAVDSGLLSKRAERLSKERKCEWNKGGRDRRRQKGDHWFHFFPSLYLFTHHFLSPFCFLFDPSLLKTSAPMGRQLTDSESRVPPLLLSSLLSLFFFVLPIGISTVFAAGGVIWEHQVSEQKPHRC